MVSNLHFAWALSTNLRVRQSTCQPGLKGFSAKPNLHFQVLVISDQEDVPGQIINCWSKVNRLGQTGPHVTLGQHHNGPTPGRHPELLGHLISFFQRQPGCENHSGQVCAGASQRIDAVYGGHRKSLPTQTREPALLPSALQPPACPAGPQPRREREAQCGGGSQGSHERPGLHWIHSHVSA